MHSFKYYNSTILTLSLFLLSFVQQIFAETDAESFRKANNIKSTSIFFDKATTQWQNNWFLDGKVGTVSHDENGMVLQAGPEVKNDAHHMVLWTKNSFSGDIKIEFDYTRLDDQTRFVNIIYILATGSGFKPYSKDIFEWKGLRTTPSMKTYFNHMNTYHISFAAFPNNENTQSYIRARRYLPQASGLKGTNLKPDYYPNGLFEKGIPHKVTIIKKNRDLFMQIKNSQQTYYCRMTNPNSPSIDEGRVGIRHMYTRSARYKNFRISHLHSGD